MTDTPEPDPAPDPAGTEPSSETPEPNPQEPAAFPADDPPPGMPDGGASATLFHLMSRHPYWGVNQKYGDRKLSGRERVCFIFDMILVTVVVLLLLVIVAQPVDRRVIKFEPYYIRVPRDA